MKRGFTLLELVIVIIVIGILVAMALPQFTRMAERGRVAEAKAALDMIRKSEGIWYAENSSYTADLTATGLARDIPEIATLPVNEWTYAVVVVATPPSFTATAIRVRGENAAATITLNNTGVVGGTHPLR